uniref:Defensin-like protein 1 n=1 Tax=Clitoria ternatea TaxID=43366 RepID=DEF1_CLITE|nr:RecName: Full=Defensin-like protein 1; AltName: Full=Cysteine-rich antimicrobial protein 1; AltName: Full=Defensin AMP1; Short=CtAMP1 [Clitoria ternatea]AAB34971.1 defensin Ct-AMP1=cysteine-rich antimicrobial protein [Clitoria ternatea, seeds, Peptide, 49 aa] [Clitoria ternatea]
NLCERASLTWTGNCGNTGHCDTQCRNWESAKHGACHKRGNWKCFCYFNC